MSLVSAEQIRKVYRTGETEVEALREVSFQIDSGSFVSFVGPSGSGKTTLLNLIGCLDRPSSGSLQVAGTDIATLDRTTGAAFRGREIGFIFQDFNLLPVLSVYENVEYPLLMVQKVPEAERRQRVMALLEAVGMSDQADKRPDQISGGQKQRVAVARALVTNPKLVLADEPTANLDRETAFMVIRLMKQMRDQLGITFVFSTHDPRIVEVAEVIHRLEDGLLKETERIGGTDRG
jgi:putative ABC transport system ATP-binding protein